MNLMKACCVDPITIVCVLLANALHHTHSPLDFRPALSRSFLLSCLLVLSLQLVSEISFGSCQVSESTFFSNLPHPRTKQKQTQRADQIQQDTMGSVRWMMIFNPRKPWSTCPGRPCTTSWQQASRRHPQSHRLRKECMMSRNGLLKQPLENERWNFMFHGKKPAPLRRNDPDARICNETFIFLTRMEHVLPMFKSYIPLSSCVCFRSVSRFLGVRLASVLGSNASSKCP